MVQLPHHHSNVVHNNCSMQSSIKPKRSLPIPPLPGGNKSPGTSIHYQDRDWIRNGYKDISDRPNGYTSGHDKLRHSLTVDHHSSSYRENERDFRRDSYRDSHSPRLLRNESSPGHLKSSSYHSLDRSNFSRSFPRERQTSYHMPPQPDHQDSRIYSSPFHGSHHDGDPGNSWQRSSLPARTRPKSPTSPTHSWQRSSLPAHSRNRVSPGLINNSSNYGSDQQVGSRMSLSNKAQSKSRPPLLSSKSEPYSYGNKKKHGESKSVSSYEYITSKDYDKQSKYDKNSNDANAPFEVHFKHKRNSSLDVPPPSDVKMKRSSSSYKDFVHSASLDGYSLAAQQQAEEDEAYRILKEGLEMAKSKVVYKFERSASEGQPTSSMYNDQQLPRHHNPQKLPDEYGLDDYDGYHSSIPYDHHQRSRREFDRISHYSSRSNPLDNSSSYYGYSSRDYNGQHDSYRRSPVAFNHFPSNYHSGSHVTQTSTQTDETSLSGPYQGYAPNQSYRYPQDGGPKMRRSFFNFNFFRNWNFSKKKANDSKYIYMKAPAPQHCTQVNFKRHF